MKNTAENTYVTFRTHKVTYRDRPKNTLEGYFDFSELISRLLSGYYGHYYYLLERDAKGRFIQKTICDGANKTPLTDDDITGSVGTVDIDGAFNTYYTMPLSSITEEDTEYRVLLKENDHDILALLAEHWGCSEIEIALARHFDCFSDLLSRPYHYDWVGDNFNCHDSDEGLEGDFVEIEGKFYTEL